MIKGLSRLDGIVAVPPGHRIDPQVGDASLDTLQAHAFIEAGWRFVHQQSPLPGSRSVYTNDSGHLFIEGTGLAVRFEKDAGREDVTRLLDKYGLEIGHELGDGMLLYEVAPRPGSPSPIEIIELSRQLEAEPLVRYANPSLIEDIGTR